MQVSNFILSAIAFLLLLFSVNLFVANQGNRLLNRLLSIVLITRFCQIVLFLLAHTGQLNVFPLFQKITIPLYFATSACFYLYVTGFMNDRSRFRKYEWLHFIPAFLAVIHVLPWSFIPEINWQAVAGQISTYKHFYFFERTGLFPPDVYCLSLALLLIGYLAAAWYMFSVSPLIKAKGWNLSKQWIFFVLSCSTVFKLLGVVRLATSNSIDISFTSSWFLALNCLMLLFIFVFVLHQPSILYGYLLISARAETGEDSANSQAVASVVSETATKKVSLLPSELKAYQKAMTELMDNEKSFLDPGFQIIHLAQKLDIPVHHCSFVINHVIGKNFRDWINSYRINYFMSQHPLKGDRMTIEAIAFESGFKNLTTFYNAFRKETGLLPTTYFSREQEQQSA